MDDPARPPQPTDPLDCVEMKREAQERIQAEIRGMSVDQELAYWKQYEERLRERIEAARGAKVA